MTVAVGPASACLSAQFGSDRALVADEPALQERRAFAATLAKFWPSRAGDPRNPDRSVPEEGVEPVEKAYFPEGSANPCEPSRRAETSRDDAPRDRSHLSVVPADAPATALDVPRAVALATAVEGFVRVGMTEHALPLAAELAALLRAAEGTCAAVAVLGSKRERR